MDLPQLNNALSLATEGRFDVLVTREMDRLARNLAKQLVLEKEFERLGVSIEYVIGEYQNTPEGQLSKHIRAVIAEYEREKINERMVRGRRQKAKSGYVVLHGNTPYGYKAHKGENGTTLLIDEPTARVVRMIFDWYTIDQWGTPTITRELNRLGISPPSVAKRTRTTRARNGWNHSQIRRIIKNETYAGKWQYGKRNQKGKNAEDYLIEVDVPEIVTPEIYEQAQNQCRKNLKRSGRKAKHEYLLGRRCICASCQSPMTAFTKLDRKNQYSYYRCPVPHTQGTHYLYRECSVTTHFRADYWDEQVWQEIRDFLTDPEKLAKGMKEYEQQQQEFNEPLESRISIIEELLTEKKRELSRVLDLYLTGEFEKEILLEKKRGLEKVLMDLKSEVESLRLQLKQTLTKDQISEIGKLAEQIAEGLTEADEDFDTRKRLVEFLGVKVVLGIENGRQVATIHGKFDHSRQLWVGQDPSTQTSSHQHKSVQLTNSREEEADSYMPNYRRSMDYRHN